MNTEDFKHTVLPLRGDIKRFALKLAAQEVMLRLWSMRARLTEGSKTKALAMTMARNIHCDNCRHRKFEAGSGSLNDRAAESLAVEAKDEIELIGRIVEQLPPLQRQVFRMKEIEGYESEEIMAITGCTADNLRKNLSRARQRIRDTYLNIGSFYKLGRGVFLTLCGWIFESRRRSIAGYTTDDAYRKTPQKTKSDRNV